MSASVLVIDDEPMFQDLTRSVLSIADYRVEAAANGFEALKLLGRSEFDVIIVDYHLPEMDGYALARLLIEHTQYRDRRPVLVALTADPDGLAVRRGSDAIFACILAKPVAPRQLLLVIDLAIKRSEGIGELAAAAAALVANPDAGTAAEASRAFWREAGLPDRPRALVVPPPTRDQSAALAICFDLCGEADGADLLITTNPETLAALATPLGPAASRLPVIGVNRIESPALDLEFTLSDRESWKRLAALMMAFAERRHRMVEAVAGSEAAADRLLCSIFAHGRAWRPECGLLLSGDGAEEAAAAEALAAAGLLRPSASWPGELELSPAGVERVTGEADPTRAKSAGSPGRGDPLERAVVAETRSQVSSTERRILILDHDDFARDVMSSVLVEAGYGVEAAPLDGDAASVLESGSHEILVLPVETWPPVDRVAAALLSGDDARRPKVVIAVAPASCGFVGQMLASGRIQGVLTRPLAPRALLDLVVELSAEMSSSTPAFDESVFADLTDLVGEPGAARLVEKLAAQLRRRFAETGSRDHGIEVLRGDAHAIKGSAAMLGLKRLSDLCGELERACDANQGVGPALTQVLRAREDALARLDRLGAAPPADPIAAA